MVQTWKYIQAYKYCLLQKEQCVCNVMYDTKSKQNITWTLVIILVEAWMYWKGQCKYQMPSKNVQLFYKPYKQSKQGI